MPAVNRSYVRDKCLDDRYFVTMT